MKLTKEDHWFIKLSFFILPNKKIKETNQITGDGYFSRYLISTGLSQLSFWLIVLLIMGNSPNLSLFLKFTIVEIFLGVLISLFVDENVHDIHSNTSKLINELMLTKEALKNKDIEMEQEQ